MDNHVPAVIGRDDRVMISEPDPDWYLDHVLSYSEPGSGATVRVTEAMVWDTWWRGAADTVRQQWPDLAAVALQQGFALTSRQLRDVRVDRHTARSKVSQGMWSAPVRGAVSLLGSTRIAADEPDRWTAARRRHALLAAAAAAVNPGHVVTGNSGGVLHGLSVLTVPDAPELTVPRGRQVRRIGARVAELPAQHLTEWYGIPTSTPARAVVDVARSDRRAGLVLADAALRNDLVVPGQLSGVLDSSAGWPGVRQARGVVSLAARGGESPLESLLRLAIHDAGLPAPTLQVTLRVPGRRVPYRVDMLWPEHRLIVEADGRVKYATDNRWAEKTRDLALHRLGYRVEHVVWSDVVHTWSATYALLAEVLGR